MDIFSSSPAWQQQSTAYHFKDIFELNRINFCELNGHWGHSSEQPVGPVRESPVYLNS